MNTVKLRAGFFYFFFFFQGVFLTVMILFAVFDHKILPVIKEKNIQIELLLKELNKTTFRNNKHFEERKESNTNNEKKKCFINYMGV